MIVQLINGKEKHSVNMNNVSVVSLTQDQFSDNIVYRLNLFLKNGSFVQILQSNNYEEAENKFIEFNNHLIEAQDFSETEKRLKDYMKQIQTKINKEVKNYLDDLTNK